MTDFTNGTAALLAAAVAFPDLDLKSQEKLARKAERRRRMGVCSRVVPVQPRGMRFGRNQPCPCGSGRKFKNCCRRGYE